MVYLSRFGSHPATIGLKYAGQWLLTWRILRREQPDVVFVMTPPVFAALPAFIYARRGDRRLVLDAHTAAFAHPRWRRWQWLQRALCRRAATTLVHNEHFATQVRADGAHATVVTDVPIVFSRIEDFVRPDAFTVAVVCSFNADEPIAAILDAAARVPDARFFVTGNPRHFPTALRSSVPGNLTLTGFLSTEAYGGLLTSADVVMALTTRDHTMLRGAYEAIYQGTPVIVSDWPVLRDAFPTGAVHVDNSALQIANAIKQIRANPVHYRDGASRLRTRKRLRWEATRAEIVARLGLRQEGPADQGDARRAVE